MEAVWPIEKGICNAIDPDVSWLGLLIQASAEGLETGGFLRFEVQSTPLVAISCCLQRRDDSTSGRAKRWHGSLARHRAR